MAIRKWASIVLVTSSFLSFGAAQAYESNFSYLSPMEVDSPSPILNDTSQSMYSQPDQGLWEPTTTSTYEGEDSYTESPGEEPVSEIPESSDEWFDLYSLDILIDSPMLYYYNDELWLG
jgi:hypothetical protein